MKVKVISLPYIFQVLYVLCFTRPRYQVSVYRTIGPLVKKFDDTRGLNDDGFHGWDVTVAHFRDIVKVLLSINRLKLLIENLSLAGAVTM